MDSYGFQWIPMDSYGFIRIPMDSYGFLWIHKDSYQFACSNCHWYWCLVHLSDSPRHSPCHAQICTASRKDVFSTLHYFNLDPPHIINQSKINMLEDLFQLAGLKLYIGFWLLDGLHSSSGVKLASYALIAVWHCLAGCQMLWAELLAWLWETKGSQLPAWVKSHMTGCV